MGPVKLHTIRHGAGYPVDFVLVHGLASSARLWDAVGAELAALDHGSLAVDLRGHGASPTPEDGYDFETMIGDVMPFLDGRPVLVGQSYGANVAAELAARHPDAVSAIVCIDGGVNDLAARFGSLDEVLVELRPPYKRFEGTTLVAREAYLRRAHPDWPEPSIEAALATFAVDQDGRVRARLPWPAHRQILTAMWENPPSKRWPDIRVPVLFLLASPRWGDAVDAAASVLQDAEVVWFDGADHDLHAQHPGEVAARLDRFIDRVPRS
jgi:pimeloyl-ACP methyl ester carboxylesterase